MPASVAGLPRSSGGLPVPYVAQWEGEEQMRIGRCEYALDRPAVFPSRGSQVGVTRPVFGVMEPSRQRECVMTQRCQVCREPVGGWVDEEPDPLVFHWLVDMLHEPPTMRGHSLALEPWVCDECLGYALQVCPGMLVKTKLHGNDRQLKRVLAVWSAVEVAAYVKPHGNLEGAAPCVSYVKVEPLVYVRIPAFHILDRGTEELRELLTSDGIPRQAFKR